MYRRSLHVVALSSSVCAFIACQNDSTSSGTTGPSDGGSSSGTSGSEVPPPPPPPGSTDAGGGDADGDKPCATTGYYAVTNPSENPGARLYRVAATSSEHDVYIGTTKTADGTAVVGFSAVTAIPGGGLVGFIGTNALTLTNTLVSIDSATALVTTLGVPTDTSQSMKALSYGGATGRFLAAYASGEVACIDLPGSQFVGLVVPNIPPNNEVLKTGALHGQCNTDGTYDLRAIHQSGTGPTSYYVHVTRASAGGPSQIVEQSPVIAIPGGDGLVDGDSVTLNGTHLVKVGVDGTVTPIRDIDVSLPGSTGPACNQSAAPGGFGGGALLAD